MKLGSATFELRAKLVDRAGRDLRRFRLCAAADGLDGRACAPPGLIQPGSLVEHAYKIRLPAGTSEARITAIRDQAGAEISRGRLEHPHAQQRRAGACPRNIERFSQFLTLVGLTALVVGGVGVANAVRAYLDGKRGVIATFKSLGASGGFVFTVYLVQILIIAGIGIVARPGARRADAVCGECGASIGHSGAGRRRHLSRRAGAWRRCSACW